MKHINALIRAKSPYLLQHAHNPVHWQEWSEEAFSLAKQEDKLVLVSIGYSACHWCHVMERECFEDEETAALMNEHFVNIKVDREERPDVDHLYMTAVQLMSGHGGWPLNCFVLPDGRPIYGGTYFPKERWVQILRNLSELHKNSREKVEEYAQQLAQGIQQVNEFTHLQEAEEKNISAEDLDEAVTKWKRRFDKKEGGHAGAPKFPMPNNYLFLLRYAVQSGNEEILEFVHLTLEKMAAGGIYDHLGGGFARYSTDSLWKAPHFEKMLYDNAQLISLYCEAYRESKNELYRKVVYETIDFVSREMTSAEGGFYSALDADSEGREGLYYVWRRDEVERLLGKDFKIFADYYSVNEDGYWEDDFYILLRRKPVEVILQEHKISEHELEKIISDGKKKLMQAREKRVRPGLDDKIIVSWNGLMSGALADAYFTFGEPRFAEMAKANLKFIEQYAFHADGGMLRCVKGTTAYGTAFLDDYALLTDAYIKLFGVTGEDHFLRMAQRLTDYCLANFYSEERGLFYYTPKRSEELIAKSFEISDNVIPASNSQVLLNLEMLNALSGTAAYAMVAGKLLSQMHTEITSALPSHTNWALAALRKCYPFYEVCVVGKDVDEFKTALAKHYRPNATFVFSKTASDLALLANRYQEGKTLAYVCVNNSCQAPMATAAEALEQIK